MRCLLFDQSSFGLGEKQTKVPYTLRNEQWFRQTSSICRHVHQEAKPEEKAAEKSMENDAKCGATKQRDVALLSLSPRPSRRRRMRPATPIFSRAGWRRPVLLLTWCIVASA